jgi:hypothetical protein
MNMNSANNKWNGFKRHPHNAVLGAVTEHAWSPISSAIWKARNSDFGYINDRLGLPQRFSILNCCSQKVESYEFK